MNYIACVKIIMYLQSMAVVGRIKCIKVTLLLPNDVLEIDYWVYIFFKFYTFSYNLGFRATLDLG